MNRGITMRTSNFTRHTDVGRYLAFTLIEPLSLPVIRTNFLTHWIPAFEGMTKMKATHLARLLLAALLLCSFTAQAAPKSIKAPKPAQPVVEEKEGVVLMPLHLLGGTDKAMQGSMEAAIVDGLQNKYTVVSGEVVANGVKEIYQKESAKKDCNADRCLVEISVKFKVGLIATAEVTKIDGGYLTALSIRDVYSNEVKSKQLTCKGCDSFQVVDKLKELSSLFAPAVPVVANAPIVTPEPVAPLSPATPANDPDASLWAEAQKSDTVEYYQAYIDSNRKGKYIAFAKARIKKLKEAPAPIVAPEAPLASGNSNDAETSLWNGVRSTNSVDDYNTYLAQYPKGKYATLARSLIAKLQEAAADQAWQIANKAGGEADYQTYLNQYPQGRYTELAKTKLNKLKADEENDLWNKADRSNNLADVEAYLARYSTGRYLAAANIKHQRLKEEAANARAQIIENIAVNMVRIPGKQYEIGKYEVTQGEWKAMMGSNPSKFTACGDNCPVEQVSKVDALKFIEALNAETGKQFRLPIWDEWEYACYGGAKFGLFGSPDYCGGDNADLVAWHDGNSDSTTHPVGQKQANGYGLYDMSGNVWEWMQDGYISENNAALSGGAWFLGKNFSRSDKRYIQPWGAGVRSSMMGFRLARTVP
jgi:hypothetical protein